MKRNKFIEKLFGYKYIANLSPRSKEIHNLSNLKSQCSIKLIKKGKYLTKKQCIKYFLEKGFNGCKHCYKSIDTDKYNG